ncbi:hypothetical protein D3C73_1046440 [compost metagenome]
MDEVGVVAHAFGLVQQVVRVHADAVASHQPRTERQEIPFAACGVEHILGVDAEAIEDQGQLVDQRDVDVALDVLHHLGRFGDPHRRHRERAGGDDPLVQAIDHRSHLWR